MRCAARRIKAESSVDTEAPFSWAPFPDCPAGDSGTKLLTAPRRRVIQNSVLAQTEVLPPMEGPLRLLPARPFLHACGRGARRDSSSPCTKEQPCGGRRSHLRRRRAAAATAERHSARPPPAGGGARRPAAPVAYRPAAWPNPPGGMPGRRLPRRRFAPSAHRRRLAAPAGGRRHFAARPSLPQSLTFGPGGLGRRRRCCGSGPPGSRPRPARPPACPPLRSPDHGPGRRPGPGGTWPVPKLAATRATTAPSSSAAPSTRRHADYLRIVAGLECIALSCAGY